MPSMATSRIVPPVQPNGKHVAFQQNKRKRGTEDGDEAGNTKRFAIQAQRRSLPVAAQEKSIVEKLSNSDTLVIVGETGSGKTTQVPQFLHAAGFCDGGKMIGVTQPRRVAAVTVATRVAEEMGVQVGEAVGYSIRFEDVTSYHTRIKYMTDGMLLREALLDPLLQKYSVIIVDEAHERTVHTDVLFGLLKGVQARRRSAEKVSNGSDFVDIRGTSVDSQGSGYSEERPGPIHANGDHHRAPMKSSNALTLILMSATVDAQSFVDYFGGAGCLHIEGRQYPVETFYTYTPEADYLDAALLTTFQVHLEAEAGDILVFLTGQEDIESLQRLMLERAAQMSSTAPKLLVVPIYAALPNEQQMKAFKPAPPGSRKVILATNIAETSVTIPGIRYVIDTGLVKARVYNPRIGIESLAVVPVSKAQACQRSGRAGREAAGKCYRLYTEAAFEKLEDATIPEIKRCNLSSVVLQLKALGIDDVLGFDFLDRPRRVAIVKALEHLYILGALSDSGKLSDPVGVQMSRFPLEPLYAKALLISKDYNCSQEMLAAIAMLSVESIFYAPRDKMKELNTARQRFVSTDGDHVTFINVFHSYNQELEKSVDSKQMEQARNKADKHLKKWCSANFINNRSLRRAQEIHRQLQGYMEGLNFPIESCGEDTTSFRRCLAASLFLNAARRQSDGTYRALASGQTVAIHPSSVLFGKKPDCVIYSELLHTNKEYIRNVTQIDSSWLAELAPQLYAIKNIEPASRTTPSAP